LKIGQHLPKLWAIKYRVVFIKYGVDLDLSQASCSVQEASDAFHETATGLLNHFYPECTTTVTSRDPAYDTPSIKAMLRRKTG